MRIVFQRDARNAPVAQRAGGGSGISETKNKKNETNKGPGFEPDR
jgi:hypothetical protein